ncbi:LysR family transcriptional regulator [Serratia nematodiphila]
MAVVDAGSFVAGGQTMGLSRSAAGKAIARLEQRLSVRLLHRTTRSLGLTDEGREFYRRGLQILASVDDAEASVAGDKGTARGVLRLTAPAAFGRRILLPLVPKFLVAWPEVQVEISFSDRLADIVEEGFDLAVRIGVTAPDTRLVSRTLARYRALLCASPAYLAARGEPLTVESLAGHEALLFSSCNQKQPWRLRDERGEWVKAPVRGRLRLDSGEALRDAALSGLGIAYLPEFMIAEDLAAGRLQQVLRAVAGEEVRIVALYPNKRLLEPRVRRFLDLLVDTLGG